MRITAVIANVRGYVIKFNALARDNPVKPVCSSCNRCDGMLAVDGKRKRKRKKKYERLSGKLNKSKV